MNSLVLVARWMIAVSAGLLYLLCVVGNWSLLIGLSLRQVRSTSLVLPFLGPVFGFVCLIAVPVAGLLRYWWVVPLAEPTLLLATCVVVTTALRRLSRNRGDS